ncbi:MAG: hypothetical protein EG824_02710 [Deltaproteobacteria bacterium]|nr:hypothetical protein [Deltaproteobacteria bacterium]
MRTRIPTGWTRTSAIRQRELRLGILTENLSS